jgi:Trypsin-co-occurring domain 1
MVRDLRDDTLLFEVTAPTIGLDTAGDEIQPQSDNVGRLVTRVAEIDLSEISRAIAKMVEGITNGVGGRASMPDELDLSFSIKVTGEAGVIVSKVGGEASMEVRMGWRKGGTTGLA